MNVKTAVLSCAGALSLAFAGVAPAATLQFSGVKLTEAQPSPGFNFGAAVDTDGATAIVGSRLGGSGSGIGSGSAYLFNASSGVPGPELIPTGGVAGDRFADAVAVSGPYALVGAPNSFGGVGGAYVFNVSDGSPFSSPLSVGATGDFFGDSVDLVGNLALIGAPGHDQNGNASGAAYLYDVTDGSQRHKFLPNDPAASAQFGYAVALDGTTAAITSRLDDGSPLGSGSLYFFDTDTGDQLLKATRSGVPTAGDRFGESVAIYDGTAIVGAPRANGGIGAAYLFDATTGQEFAQPLVPSDGAIGFNFGVSVAIADGLALVGASSAAVDGVITGAVYAYNLSTGEEVAKLVLLDRAMGDNLGISIAASNGATIFGSSFDSNPGLLRAGAAFLLELSAIPEPSSVLLVMAIIVGSAVRTGRNG